MSDPKDHNTMSVSNTAAAPHQIYSLMLLYPRLAGLVGAPLITPVGFGLMFAVANALTDGHALVTMVCGFGLWQAGLSAIRYYVHDPVHLHKVMTMNRNRLPMMAFGASAVLAKMLPYLVGNALAWYPWLSDLMTVFASVTYAVLILQVGVVLRYFGPLSIMRCSSVPLVSNPFESYVWYLIKYPGSIFEPGEASPSHQFRNETIRGRRFHHPSFTATSMLLILNGLLGCALFAGIFQHQSKTSAAALMACIQIMTSPMYKYVRQNQHELDPRAYLNLSHNWSGITAMSTLGGAAVKASGIWVAAVLVDWMVVGERWMLPWIFSAGLFFFSLLCLWIQTMWEECLRVLLFHPRQNVLQDLLEMTDGSHTQCVQIILQCLLVDDSLVQEICSMSSHQSSRLLLEPAISAQTANWSERHGRQLLHKLPLYVEAHLEEDAVRFGILEALGGPDDRGIAQERLDLVAPLTHGGKFQEPPCATLVRGFCVWIGGMGRALENIVHLAHVKPTERRWDTWELSVGGLVSCEYAVQSLVRWLAARSVVRERTAQQLRMLRPAALTSLYTLHHGLTQCRREQVVTMHFESVQRVLRACEAAGARISRELFEGATSRPPVDPKVWQWLVKTRDLLSTE